MNRFQKINHFPGAWSIGSKANLWRNVQKQRRKHGKEFELCPPTYVFPEDYKRFCNDREMNNYKDMYILKPTAASCGRGIKVIGKKDTVNKRNGYLVSKYLSKPHLLRGFKYDLRIYIVVTSFDPLKAYIYQDGLVRLATQQYTTSKNSLKKRFIHLTNYSVNKKGENYVKNNASKNEAPNEDTKDEEKEEVVESKWSLKQLKEEYKKMGISYSDIYAKIKDLCVKTLMAVEPAIVQATRSSKYKNQCFEIYGFDILIDQSLKPWLLEVNVAPSLSSSSHFDKIVKSMLLCDTMHLIGYQIFDRKKIGEERKREKRKSGGIVAQYS
jgi:tubulin polyglutamylase TTLL4